MGFVSRPVHVDWNSKISCLNCISKKPTWIGWFGELFGPRAGKVFLLSINHDSKFYKYMCGCEDYKIDMMATRFKHIFLYIERHSYLGVASMM
jgi:hypothetical protein